MASQLTAAFGRGKDNRGWLFDRDPRTLPEILTAWMELEECASERAFLRATGVGSFMAENVFKGVHNGWRVLGPRITTLCAMHLAGGVIRPDEPIHFLPGFYGFKRAGEFWRRSQVDNYVGGTRVTEFDTSMPLLVIRRGKRTFQAS
jgi:hypothetical protein